MKKEKEKDKVEEQGSRRRNKKNLTVIIKSRRSELHKYPTKKSPVSRISTTQPQHIPHPATKPWRQFGLKNSQTEQPSLRKLDVASLSFGLEYLHIATECPYLFYCYVSSLRAPLREAAGTSVVPLSTK